MDEAVKRSDAWPSAPNALSNRLKRLSPTLREAGIRYEENVEGHSRRKIKTLRKVVDSTDRTGRSMTTEEYVEVDADDAVGVSSPLSEGDGSGRFASCELGARQSGE